jgi:hypothetical protein
VTIWIASGDNLAGTKTDALPAACPKQTFYTENGTHENQRHFAGKRT